MNCHRHRKIGFPATRRPKTKHQIVFLDGLHVLGLSGRAGLHSLGSLEHINRVLLQFAFRVAESHNLPNCPGNIFFPDLPFAFQHGFEFQKHVQPLANLPIFTVELDFIPANNNFHAHGLANLPQMAVLRTEQSQNLILVGKRNRGFSHKEPLISEDFRRANAHEWILSRGNSIPRHFISHRTAKEASGPRLLNKCYNLHELK